MTSRIIAAILGLLVFPNLLLAELKTWDGKHSIEQINVTVVYFVPRDRTPLADWKQRVEYFCRRIEQFHAREFQGQSTLKANCHPEPLLSTRGTEQLRSGDADFIYFQTLRETDARLAFAREKERTGFPILLVLSDINWRPLDDFFRLKPTPKGLEFEGNYNAGRHFPGAAAGGSRASYLADRGVGWGLVSADGWRVPYPGSDCVVYHEGVGHSIGLPHTKQDDANVMSMGQYHGWINQSWVDLGQKRQLGWQAADKIDPQHELFTSFVAQPQPLIPRPEERVTLELKFPAAAKVKSLRVRLQTDITGPWMEVPVPALSPDAAPGSVTLGQFDRPTPVSYRIDVQLADDKKAELWGYFQVRAQPELPPQPAERTKIEEQPAVAAKHTVDLLALIDVQKDKVSGNWQREGNKLLSPKEYGSRIEIPYETPAEYELLAIVEPLDKPNAFNVGHRLGGNRFLTILNYQAEGAVNALENINGKNYADNPSTVRKSLFEQNRLSQVIYRVTRQRVEVFCDGQKIIDWQGSADALSLSDYWSTPRKNALFLGAYDCRYRIHRLTLAALKGEGKKLAAERGE